MNVTAEAIQELSAQALATEVGCSPVVILKAFKAGEVPGAYQTDGGQWRCPRWCWARYQAVRAGLDPVEVLA